MYIKINSVIFLGFSILMMGSVSGCVNPRPEAAIFIPLERLPIAAAKAETDLDQGVEVNGPSSEKHRILATQAIQDVVCGVVSRCSKEWTADSCKATLSKVSLAAGLGVSGDLAESFGQVIALEAEGKIRTDAEEAYACLGKIAAASCDETVVKDGPVSALIKDENALTAIVESFFPLAEGNPCSKVFR